MQILFVSLFISGFAKDTFILLAMFDRGLFCPTDNAVDAINHPTLFCTISGENENSSFIAWHVGLDIPTYKCEWYLKGLLDYLNCCDTGELCNTQMGCAIIILQLTLHQTVYWINHHGSWRFLKNVMRKHERMFVSGHQLISRYKFIVMSNIYERINSWSMFGIP